MILLLITLSILAYFRTKLWINTLIFVVLEIFIVYFNLASNSLVFFLGLIASIFIFLNIKPLRQKILTKRFLALYRKISPAMSTTEQEALESGNVFWEGELFKGNPCWQRFLNLSPSTLSAEEKAFLDGPVEELCAMLDDWEITQHLYDLPQSVWQFLKANGFFALIIPKEYGGKGFSARAHSEILIKISSVSVTVASTVAVPNSLGPAELLLHYGTEEQKNYYLPRLADGREIPCFALTSPEAGSDASAMPDYGIVCKGEHEGKDVIGIRLYWNKRYITLAPVATVLGLAFKLYDPEHLLGDKEELGITCALIPTNTAGVKIGRRHFPLNIPFMNGPTQGEDVFIPADWIIGGANRAGHGWRMLMECLAAGRAISLPSNAIGGSKAALASSSAYGRVRQQFGLPIGRFEGVAEVLARMAANLYLIDSGRLFTLAAIDQGLAPAVPSAIMKYHGTERGRMITSDAMDIHGGKGICLGPKNYLGRLYQSIPISITVEGANILTRSMIVFGQGAVRCHPFVLAEMQAAKLSDPKAALKIFDKAFFGHLGFMVSNVFRSFILSLTDARFVIVPKSRIKRYYQKLTRYSSAFALLSDTVMFLLGGSLKRREAISARLGDILSTLYLLSAVVKRFKEDNEPAEDLPLIEWLMEYHLFHLQQHFSSLLSNLSNRFVTGILRILLFPFGTWEKLPLDELTHKVANLLLDPTLTRTRLIQGAYFDKTMKHPLGLLEHLFSEAIQVEPLEKRVRQAEREGKITGLTYSEKLEQALSLHILTEQEVEFIMQFDGLRKQVIAVDDFDKHIEREKE